MPNIATCMLHMILDINRANFTRLYTDCPFTWTAFRIAMSKNLCFLGTFARLRKTTVSFIMSVRPHGTIQLPLEMDFREI